jgi:AraC family transcriptional activator of pobA
MRGKQPVSSTPIYELYGERGKGSILDGLHLESIAERSRLHNWNIRPHRHAALLQWLLIERGRAEVEIDGHAQTLRGPGVVWVPPFAVHGFRFVAETRGHVVTLDQTWLRGVLSGTAGLWEELAHPRVLELRGAADTMRALRRIAESLRVEFTASQRWRSQSLAGAVLMLVGSVARLPRLVGGPTTVAGDEQRAMRHLRRYREQVERRFRSQPTLAGLVEPLGITTTQLNRLCRRHLRCSALDVLHQRLLLEAKRELRYTALQVRQISDGLGFSDPAYFTRFFRRLAGRSPQEWRALPGPG